MKIRKKISNFVDKLLAWTNKSIYSNKRKVSLEGNQEPEVNMEWLNCTVTKGQFSGEYAVQGRLFNSEEFSMFVPENWVRVKESPLGGKRVDGQIRVNVLDEKGDLVLISLPAPTLENGQTITVQRNQLQVV